MRHSWNGKKAFLFWCFNFFPHSSDCLLFCTLLHVFMYRAKIKTAYKDHRQWKCWRGLLSIRRKDFILKEIHPIPQKRRRKVYIIVSFWAMTRAWYSREIVASDCFPAIVFFNRACHSALAFLNMANSSSSGSRSFISLVSDSYGRSACCTICWYIDIL